MNTSVSFLSAAIWIPILTGLFVLAYGADRNAGVVRAVSIGGGRQRRIIDTHCGDSFFIPRQGQSVEESSGIPLLAAVDEQDQREEREGLEEEHEVVEPVVVPRGGLERLTAQQGDPEKKMKIHLLQLYFK